MAVMVYALYTFHWRAASIRRGGRGPYDDRVGPVSTPPPSETMCVLMSTFRRQSFASRYSVGLLFFIPTCADFATVAIVVNFVLRFTESSP